MMNPKVSIIVPCYGVEKYLNRCMESLVHQTLQDIEIIMVDDRSPDSVPVLCDEWAKKDNRIKVIHKPVNEGLGLARNTGLEIAAGEYVAFVDSDDYVDVDMYRKLYETAISRNLDTCYCSFCYEAKNGMSVKRHEADDYEEFKGREAVDDFLLTLVGPMPYYRHEVKYLMSVWKAVYSLKLLREYNLKFDNEKEMASEDILFHVNYLHKAEAVGFLPDNFYHYCENAGSISSSYSEHKFNLITKSNMEVKKRLAACFSEKTYMVHFQRYLFLSIRGVLTYEYEKTGASFREKLAAFRRCCLHPAYSDLFKPYPYAQLGVIKGTLYLAMKYRISLILYLFISTKQFLKR